MLGPSGLWLLDGIDIWDAFAIGIESGLAQFLPLPERKESITHDWPDQNGLDIDVSKHYYKERTVTLTCWLICEESEFWAKRNAFIAQLSKPGQRRLTVSAHGGRSYFIIYKNTSGYTQVKTHGLKNIPTNMVVHQFSIILIEPMPQLEVADIFIAGDNGDFLVV